MNRIILNVNQTVESMENLMFKTFVKSLKGTLETLYISTRGTPSKHMRAKDYMKSLRNTVTFDGTFKSEGDADLTPISAGEVLARLTVKTYEVLVMLRKDVKDNEPKKMLKKFDKDFRTFVGIIDDSKRFAGAEERLFTALDIIDQMVGMYPILRFVNEDVRKLDIYFERFFGMSALEPYDSECDSDCESDSDSDSDDE